MKINFAVLMAAGLMTTSAFAADNKPVTLFNGKDLTGWKVVGRGSNQWQVGQAALDPAAANKLKSVGPGEELICPRGGVNLATEAKFRDCILEVEFMMGKNSNAGIKLMNIYEIQLLDSFGKAVAGKGDCGAVYQEVAPKVNACKKAGEWQSMVIDFRAPRFDGEGKKTANAKFVKVTLNGQVIHENVELSRGTGAGGKVAKEVAEHVLYLQGDHGPVAFRNMKLTPL